MTSREKFIAFMLRLTGKPPLIQVCGCAYSWRIHGVLVTLWFDSGGVKIYHCRNTLSDYLDDTSSSRWRTSYFHFQQEACREHLTNLTWRYPTR